jgi:prepilin-type N-terminal cleavage/methylation domain-containing protein
VRAGRRAFTLIELLLVISLVGLVLGLGLGAFTRVDLGDRIAPGLVHNVIRSARNWAVARQAPARVRIDAASNSIRAEGLRVIGTWHFESLPVSGAFGLAGSDFAGVLADDGYQGRALSFDGDGSRVDIPVQLDPAYDLADGFVVACALKPRAQRGGAVLSIGDAVGLDTTSKGGLAGWFVSGFRDEQGRLQRGGRIPIEAPPGVLSPARWSRVELAYDRRALRLAVDGVLVAQVEENQPVWRIEGPLSLSPGRTTWPGALDSLVISAVVAEDASVLPKSVTFAPGAPPEIVFDAGGGLDRRVHREPVRFALQFEDGRSLPITVNGYGTVE